MEFRLPLHPPSQPKKIRYGDKLLLMGSCFTENMYEKLVRYKFDCMQNPFGILFNPDSIHHAIKACVEGQVYTSEDVFYLHEAWHSWAHHSRFSHPEQAKCVAGINEAIELAHSFLQEANWLVLTLGSAWGYVHQARGTVVANCHKAPAETFTRKLMSLSVVETHIRTLIESARTLNPSLHVILTVSPVRHLREGFIENNQSKATLLLAVHEVVKQMEEVYYFPSYELVMDDLRDYRFFAEDMVHPNYLATQYVWEQFVATSISPEEYKWMKEIEKVQTAVRHRPFNPHSGAHAQFKSIHLEKVRALSAQFPYMDWSEAIHHFE